LERVARLVAATAPRRDAANGHGTIREERVMSMHGAGGDERVDHGIGIYDTPGFLVGVVTEFVSDALASEAMVVVVLPPAQLQVVERDLATSGLDIPTAKRHGTYVTVDPEALRQQVTTRGTIDMASYRTMADHLVSKAMSRGRELHICGTMHSILWEAGELATVLELEGMWHVLPGAPRMRLLCLYHSEIFRDGNGDDPFLALCQRHTSVGPVEDYASLVGPEHELRGVALLEQQQREDARARALLTAQRQEIDAEIDRDLRAASDQQHQFDRAVASRDLIGQAKGILMARWHLDADTAFELLRNASSRSHRKLVDVARAVVEQQLRRS
jgi:hypothetical protein